MTTIPTMDDWDSERVNLLKALHHTVTYAEGLVEQVRRLRLLLERRAEVSAEDLAALRVEEAKWTAHNEALRRRLRAAAIEPPARAQ